MPMKAPTASALKTASAIQPPHAAPASATTRKTSAHTITKLKASASVRIGFFMPSSQLQDVDRGVDHDPHYVHEVPVDPWDLDAEMIVRGRPVVSPHGADQRVQQQVQPDEDVRAVQARQTVEGRSERVVVRRESEAGGLPGVGPHEDEA